MTDKDATRPEVSKVLTERQQPDYERMLFGSNGFSGTFRMIGLVLAFVLVFGTLFYFLGGPR
jgi:hypothetical protein